jgi:hypothetical protein
MPKPPLGIDGRVGQPGELAQWPAGPPPRCALGRNPVQSFRPLRAEGTRQLPPDAPRQTRALATRRDRQQQIAAAHLRGIVEVAQARDVLDVDQASRGPRDVRKGCRHRQRQIDDPQQRDARDVVGARQPQVQA